MFDQNNVALLLKREKSCRAASNNARGKNRTDLSFEMKIEHWPGYNPAVLEKIVYSDSAGLFAREHERCFAKNFQFPCLKCKSCITRKRIAGEGANEKI